MSAPHPPADGQPQGDTAPDAATPTSGIPTSGSPTSGSGGSEPSYDFHGEKLDFDPYRFGRPEPTTPTWAPPGAPTGPTGDPGRPPAPGERWQPGQDAGTPPVKPGDYWGGAGSHRGTFPPAGYVPPPSGPPSSGDDRIDLGKPADPTGRPTSALPPGYPTAPTTSTPPPYGAPSPYPAPPAPGAYPGQPAPSSGGSNGFAVAGLVVGIVGLLLSITSWPGLLIGVVGLVLAVIGLVRARRGASGKGLAVAGVVLSALAVVISAVVLVVVLSRVDFDCLVNANGDTSQAQECIR